MHASVSVVQAAVKGLSLAQAAAGSNTTTSSSNGRSLEQANHALWGAVGAVMRTAVATPAWQQESLSEADSEVCVCFYYILLFSFIVWCSSCALGARRTRPWTSS